VVKRGAHVVKRGAHVVKRGAHVVKRGAHVVKRGAHVVLLGKPEGKAWCRFGYNIKTGLREIGWQAVYWIDMAQDSDKWLAVVNTLRVP
jgi:hypothetical protein